MISMNDIEKLSDYECINLIYTLINRLKETTYAHGYKDGFNDAKDAEYQKSLFMKSEGQYEKAKDIDRKKCKYYLGQIITMGTNKKEYEVVDISSEPWIEYEDGSMHYGITIKPCNGSLRDAIFLSDAQID